ncbi:hypothetical protein LR48_Vigan09g056700 [Vigna angularis]|uniref:Uncharacterized protein n=1 Tax=Phaseolus angularis TaxID=3914 RepID=A0A0L9VA66_PHAAN|nr:hypothetical protein LR48_Vigan09g056700 [Vigna angularis]
MGSGSAQGQPKPCEFGERSEEGERWNQKRHQKVQKEKPQLPLSGSLPLSGTQELTGDPLRGKMAAEGKKPTHALTIERVLCLMSAGCNLVKNLTIWALSSTKNLPPQQWKQKPSVSGRRITLEEASQQYIQIPNCHHKNTQAAEEFDRPPPQQWQQQPSLSESFDDTLQRFLKNSDSTQKSIEESCKRMEMHLRYISQRLNVKVNIEVNLKEEGQAIVTKSDKILDEKKIGGDEEKIERKEKEELSEKNKDEEKEKEVVEREERKKFCVKIKKLKRKRKGKKKIREKKKRKFRERKRKKKNMRGKKKKSYEKSHPHLKKNHRKEKKFKCFMEIFKKLEIKEPMIETLQQGLHLLMDVRQKSVY